MSLESIAPHGPFTCEVMIHMTNGEDMAQASFDCPIGHAPAEADLATLAEKALEAVRAQLGDGWRLQTRDEFVQARLCEQAGAPASFRFAVPEGDFAHGWAK